MVKWPFSRKRWPDFSMDEIRKRARVLVIDDVEFAYLYLFKKDGYTIDKWNDVDDLPKLESGYYDIVLLDIQGVGKELSQEQGLGILKHLRKTCPAQIIIAYSNADFSLKYQRFFRMADETLSKSDDYVQFKRIVDRFLADRFSLGFYVDRIAKLASPYLSDTIRVKELSKAAIFQGKNTKLVAYLKQHVDSKEALSMILQVVQVAIGIASL